MNNRKHSKSQEKQVAKLLGGKVSPNSGATLFGGSGDVHTGAWNIECKTVTTPKQSISIKHDWIKQSERDAFAMGKPYSAVAVNFGPDEENYFVISEKLFKKFLKTLEESEDIKDASITASKIPPPRF